MPDCEQRNGHALTTLTGGLLGIRVQLEVPADLGVLFRAITSHTPPSPTRLHLRASHRGGRHWMVEFGTGRHYAAAYGPAALHYALDKALILALQHRRPELLFMHAAVLGTATGAVAVLAASGGGKSTTSLAAYQAGLHCFSDELAPIDLQALQVWPYPRALALKRRPESIPSRLRQRMRQLDRQWFLPLDGTWKRLQNSPVPLRALVVLDKADGGTTRVGRLSGSTALANVYSHCLNPLAHANGGLPAVRNLLASLPCFRLVSTSPDATVAVLRTLLSPRNPAGDTSQR